MNSCNEGGKEVTKLYYFLLDFDIELVAVNFEIIPHSDGMKNIDYYQVKIKMIIEYYDIIFPEFLEEYFNSVTIYGENRYKGHFNFVPLEEHVVDFLKEMRHGILDPKTGDGSLE